jgi:DNA polymerase
VDLITLDFETFYDKDFSLSKLTTEEYIRDPRFQIIGVGVKVNDWDTDWASGTYEEIEKFLADPLYDWDNSMVLAHNTLFDGAILSWLFDIKPKVWADTLSIGRAIHGVEVSGSLKALAERYGVGQKGTEVLDAKGKKREDFTAEELSRYGDYCINDVELTYKLFSRMLKGFPKQELKIIDATLRMFTEPVLELDLGLLESHLENVKDRKDELMLEAGVSKKDLMSNDKFAELLRQNGVEPPMKVSPTTDKETYAFAKTDDGFKALAESPSYEVQVLVAARLGNKSTLEETRTQRFIDIAKRGPLPIPLRYYAAHTGRWGGSDKINLQNLPSRGPDGKHLKRSILAPDNCVLIDCDSSQIEARVLAWLAGQQDLVQAFHDKEDVYVKMASRIYNLPEDQISKDQRFVGKTTILGAGYGMGSVKFQAQLKTFGVDIDLEEARRIIDIYRKSNGNISRLWRDSQFMIKNLANKVSTRVGCHNVIQSLATQSAVSLPSGLVMRYEDLRAENGERGYQYTYKTRKGRTKIYGGKFVENACQALARCIIGEQMLRISTKYKIVLTVHDSLVVCVKEDEVQEARTYIEDCMRTVPTWAHGLPLDCESGVAKAYGDCE